MESRDNFGYEIVDLDRESTRRRQRGRLGKVGIAEAREDVIWSDGFVYGGLDMDDPARQPIPAEGIDGIEFDEDDPEAWKLLGLCRQTDPETFFPERGGSTREAKGICQGCEVREACLDYALAHKEPYGIWGGLSERERRRLKQGVI